MAEMGEIDELPAKGEAEQMLNGDSEDAVENDTEDSQSSNKKSQTTEDEEDDEEPMDVDEQAESIEDMNKDDNEDEEDVIDDNDIKDGNSDDEVLDDEQDDDVMQNEGNNSDEEEVLEEQDDNSSIGSNKDANNAKNDDKSDGTKDNTKPLTNGEQVNVDNDEVHEILDDDDGSVKNGLSDKNDEPIELNDSGEGEGDGDVMIIDEPKENGSKKSKPKDSTLDELEVIELDDNSAPTIKKTPLSVTKTLLTPRRSSRNMNKAQSYAELEREVASPQSSEESDIEEILPEDPLAMNINDRLEIKRTNKHFTSNHLSKTTATTTTTSSSASSSTIVVKDTKRLVEIAAKSNNSNSGNKKEPTLVIIDTNSILSGRGPVPVNKSSSQSYSTMLPMALPAQGMYPPNMRATITPIPLNSSNTQNSSKHSLGSGGGMAGSLSQSSATTLAPVLPTLTDDMFVVEAPSFIVPYVYEKPPMNDFKDFLKDIAQQIQAQEDEEKKTSGESSKNDDEQDDEKMDTLDSNVEQKHSDNSREDSVDDPLNDLTKKSYSYFDSALGKFFMDIGFNLVQEYVQADLLKQQKRKRDREGGQNITTNRTINSLIKDLEFSKENNEPFKLPMKKCEFCNFKTESALVLANHLEMPHTKNFVYKCNYCTYEARSPHDILFHMEAVHAVRGRLDRAPCFHQCPNCPFEDNQKGKLSRHLVTCMRKFKPERNMEAPIDWEPPAKIPRVPKSRQGLNQSAYQAMKNTSSQLQLLTKMQLLNQTNTQQHALHRGRGRPSMAAPVNSKQAQQQAAAAAAMLRPSGMVYKQTMSGGSVLVPTNYQLSGNQVYQQNQSKNKSLHQPSISITPLPRSSSSPSTNMTSKPGDTNSKNSFVICEICDGYIKDLEQLRNHMQWIHKVKIHPKMIYNRPPLNCQKCQFRFFTDQGLERHLLGSHGLVTSSMQDAANKSKDAGRCPVCGRVYQWKLLNHVARDHNMTLKPAHLSYKCTVCTATFGMYKQFENHVYSAHSVVAKRVMDKKNSSSSSTSASTNKNDQILKPLKINDEITIIPQPAKTLAGTSKEGSPSSSTGSTNSRNSTPSTSKSR